MDDDDDAEDDDAEEEAIVVVVECRSVVSAYKSSTHVPSSGHVICWMYSPVAMDEHEWK